MTACTNNGGKARRVVTAALVGVLSVGAVPAIALATGTGDVSLLAEDANYADSGTVQYENASTTFYWNGKGQGRVPETVTTGDNQPHDVSLRPVSGKEKDGEFYYYYVEIDSDKGTVTDPSEEGAAVQYLENGKLTPLKGTSVKDADGNFVAPFAKGDYAVVIGQYVDGKWNLRDVADTFSIVGFSLDEAKLVDGKDVADTTFEFSIESGENNAAAWEERLGVAVGNHVLTKDTDYTIDIVKKDDGTSVSGGLQVGVKYQAVIDGIDGIGAYEGHKVIDFQIQKLDLGSAKIIGKTVTKVSEINARTFKDLIKNVNGIENENFSIGIDDSEFTVELVSTPDGKKFDSTTPAKGAYTFEVTAHGDNPYVTGHAQFVVNYADQIADIDFSGCGTWDAPTAAYVVNMTSEKPTIFDLSHIKVTLNDGLNTPTERYTVVVKDANGNVVDMGGKTQITDFGTYYVEVTVAYTDETTGNVVAGSSVAKVVVLYQGVATATDVFMTYRGENVESRAEDTYDGTDLSKNMAFTVKAGDKTLAQGTDYEVTFEKQADDGTRTAVEEIVDAGTYIITVQGKTYDGKAEFTFVVSPVKPDEAKVVWDVATADGGGYLAYTGDVLTPSFRFFDAKDNEIDVPEGSYVVDKYEIYSDGDWTEAELKEVGTYRAYLETAEGVENYDLDMVADNIVVSEKKLFLDVPANEWYSQGVYDAAKLGYMNGEGGGKTFGPMRELTRAEAACVLFNMAGGDDMYPDATIPGYDVHEKVYDTDYTDVEGNEFFAKAIAWCEATGIINGYADGTFGVSRNVTNEEFACMLANYAKAKNEYKAVDADEVLAAYPDASVVSDWAKDSVAWAVSQKIMGGGANISPAGSILRMRAATMAVNAQSKKLGDLVITIPTIQ